LSLFLIESQNSSSAWFDPPPDDCDGAGSAGAGVAGAIGATMATSFSTTGPVSEEESHGVCRWLVAASTLPRTARCASSIEMPGVFSSSTNASAYGLLLLSPSTETSPGAVE
jgi:hypothetical protein